MRSDPDCSILKKGWRVMERGREVWANSQEAGMERGRREEQSQVEDMWKKSAVLNRVGV